MDMRGCLQVGLVLSNTMIGMLLATINSSIILALDIFRRIHLDPLTPVNTN